MKIKTITCHDVYNYGASLQAYALMKYLQSQGHDVEIIDYKPDYLSQRYNIWSISVRFSQNTLLKIVYYLIKIPQRLIVDSSRKKAFDKFTKSYLSRTQKTYHTNEELKANIPQAEIYLAGSDQIWNSMYPNGKDPAFYLDFAPKASVKASYAASFSVKYIEEGYAELVSSWIQQLDYISVRESSGMTILQSIGIMRGMQVMDPVFLLPLDEWNKLAAFSNVTMQGKYILIYDFENNPELECFTKELSRKTGYRIVSIKDYRKQKYADKCVNNAGPREFIELINNCEIFVSNSFHGTAFSIIYNKEFYVFNRIHQEVNSRMIDLLSSLNLNDRLIDKDKKQDFSEKINYAEVNILLKREVLVAKSYLDRVCNGFQHSVDK